MGIKVVAPFENGNAEKTKLGNFTIQFFPLEHDVVNFGMFIKHESMGSLLFLTDTCYCKYSFQKLNVNHIMIEANYSKDFINPEDVNRNRVLQTHMELQTSIDFITTNDNPMLKNIVLIHLSTVNSDRNLFQQKTKEVTNAEVFVAEKGLTVNIDLIPF